MSRTNGPGAPPPNRWPERPQAQAAPHPDQGYQQPFGGQHQQGFGAPPQQQFQPQAPYPAQPQHPQPQQPAYHYPDLGHGGDSYSQPTLGVPAPLAPSYAPQFEPYAPPPTRTAAPQPQDRLPPAAPQHGWGAPETDPRAYPQFEQPTQPSHRSRDPRIVSHEPAFSHAPPPAPAPEWPPAPQLRGSTYDQHPGWPEQPQQAAPAAYADGYPAPQPQGFGAQDTYAQQGYAQQEYAQQPAEWPPQPQGYGSQGYAAAEQGYAHGGGYADPAGYHGGYGEQAGYGQQHGYAQAEPAFGAAEQQVARADEGFGAPVPAGDVEDYDHDEMEYEDDRRGGRGRMVMIAAALVGAIGIGGGLAYGYKVLFNSGPSGATPVVRSQSEPSKIKPLDPGGKKFAHTDSKILGRLDSGSEQSSSAAPSAGANDEDGAPRKVTTMVVGRDGSIVPAVASPPPGAGPSPVSEPAPVAAPPQRVAGVPGLTIVDGFGGRPPAQLAPVASPPPAARVVPVAPVAPAAPVVLTRPNPPPAIAKPTVISRAAPEPKAEEPEPAEVAKPVAKKVVKKPVNDAFGSAGTSVAAATPAAPAEASSGAAGYVAVLVSIPTSPNSRMDALKQFADLQQRYPGQLNSKSPEVQSANLAGKGSFDRLIAGPPGSRQQANDLCAQLKTAGYSSCWVKSY